MELESEPFLSPSAKRSPLEESVRQRSKLLSHARAALHERSLTVHFALILLYTALSYVLIRVNCQVCSWVPTNAIDGLSTLYSAQPQELYNSSEYAGHPLDPDVDEAWRKLLRHMDIRVTAAELARNNRESVQLPEGRGYLAWLGVFHELHCLKLLRQWKYKEQYFPNMTIAQAYDMESHTDHCLDRIRAMIICHPDIASITTFFWDSSTKPTVNGTKTLHSCVDWDVLMDSMIDRTVSSEEVDALVNPSL